MSLQRNCNMCNAQNIQGWHYENPVGGPPQYNDFDMCFACLQGSISGGTIKLPPGMEMSRFVSFPKPDLSEHRFEILKLMLQAIDKKLDRLQVSESIEKRLAALEAVSHKQPSMEDMFRVAQKIKDEADRTPRFGTMSPGPLGAFPFPPPPPGFSYPTTFGSQPSIQPVPTFGGSLPAFNFSPAPGGYC